LVSAGATGGTPGLAYASRVFALLETMYTSIFGDFKDSKHLIVVEVALLDLAGLQRDLLSSVLAVRPKKKTMAAFHLRFYPCRGLITVPQSTAQTNAMHAPPRHLLPPMLPTTCAT